ncbi:MAG: acyl-CoA reductase [Cytophagaceae bacterium]
MDLEKRINLFLSLHETLKSAELREEWAKLASNENRWFTEDNVQQALIAIAGWLTREEIENWLRNYDFSTIGAPKNVGVILAGNIPLVGFHDIFCVIMSGHSLHLKLSSDDRVLPQKLIQLLQEFNPLLQQKIFIADQLKGMDAIIATGSDNTSRYFEYYFSKVPHIIRKNRTSVGILTGEEEEQDIALLGNDIFQYFGLGCRNVSKLFVPQDYDVTTLFPHWQKFEKVADHNKYFNNYEYNKAIYLVNRDVFLDNGFVMLKEDKSLVSPVSVIFYERYSDMKEIKSFLKESKEKIQAVIGKGEGMIPFGQAQCPSLSDYADGVDTMKFLLKL